MMPILIILTFFTIFVPLIISLDLYYEWKDKHSYKNCGKLIKRTYWVFYTYHDKRYTKFAHYMFMILMWPALVVYFITIMFEWINNTLFIAKS